MSPSSHPFRSVLLVALVAAVATTSGCGWLSRKNGGYDAVGDARPLEMPPPYDANAAQAEGGTGSVTRSSLGGGAPSARPVSFALEGDRATTFQRVGDVLAGVPGLVIASRAQLLGAYDVDYEGTKFLVRVSETTTGTLVSAVDPRGLPADGEAPRKLIEQLRTTLGGK